MATAIETLASGEPCTRPLLFVIYGIARTFGRLHFIAHEHCLGLREALDVQEQFNILRTASQRIDFCLGVAELEKATEAAQDDFWNVVDSEWWSEVAFERNDEILTSNGSESVIEDAYWDVLAPLDRILRRLKESLLARLDLRGQSAFQIGLLLEMLQCRAEVEQSRLRHGPPTRAEFAYRGLAQSRNQSLLHYGSDPLAVLPLWYAQVCAWWRELGFAEPPLNSAESPEHLADAVCAFVEDLDAAFYSEVRLSSASAEVVTIPSPPGYLGLVLDDHSRTVGREGLRRRSRSFTPRQFALIRRFVSRGARGFSRRELEHILANDGTPNPSAITTLLTELRRKLAPIGIGITGGRGDNRRRLFERDSDPSPL